MDKIVAGGEYVFTSIGCEVALTRFGIYSGSITACHNEKTVTINSVKDVGETQRVWINASHGMPAYYYPPECFTPVGMLVEMPTIFKEGGVYICDGKPEDIYLVGVGWTSRMTKAIGLPLTFDTYYYGDRDVARLNYKINGVRYRSTYLKSWVRPYKSEKKVMKRNLFNFWPGSEKEEND